MVPPPSSAGFPSLGSGRWKGKENKLLTISADTSRILVIMSSPDLWSIWSPPFQLRVTAIYLLPFRKLNVVFTGSKSPKGTAGAPGWKSLFWSSLPPASHPQYPTQSTFGTWIGMALWLKKSNSTSVQQQRVPCWVKSDSCQFTGFHRSKFVKCFFSMKLLKLFSLYKR